MGTGHCSRINITLYLFWWSVSSWL